MFMPNTGRADIRTGNTAQCMAQAKEVMIPRASQLSLMFMLRTKVTKMQYCCKYFVAGPINK
jgi:hypothetical protein